MPNNAELAAELLRNAATFFRDVGTQNPALKNQMSESARTFETIADLVETDPVGKMPNIK
ncbi:MAG TPA: hypothetical protein ENI72_01695 [Rhodospirillales bacterium]|nr:hypothetical protein [Rhodospirillales bacterium]